MSSESLHDEIEMLRHFFNAVRSIGVDSNFIILESRPLIRFKSENKSENKSKYKHLQSFLYDDNENCSICYEGMKSDHCIQCKKCENVFHQKCIEPWIKNEKNCPICRTPIKYEVWYNAGKK